MPAPAEGGAQAKPDAQNALSAPVAAPTPVAPSAPVAAPTPVAPSPLVTAASPPAVTAQSLSPSAVSAPDSVLSVPAQVLPDVPVPAPAIPEAVSPQPPLTDENARRAYASGVSLAGEVLQSLAVQKSLGISLPPDLILAGLQDGFNHKPLRIADDDIRMQVNSLNHDFSARLQARREDEVAQGRQYRQDFRKRKGAFFDAGSLYLVSNKGAPTHLTTSDIATLSIDGTLPDGTVFDGSGQAGQSRKVKVGAMLPAVAIGLQKVGVGGHITVVVPPEKGYGDMGLPPVVPGGSTLIFDITVKGVNESGDAPTEP
nr:FKBP-type peptidyl-prolyl cis-trans isomerase [Rahnella aceris]